MYKIAIIKLLSYFGFYITRKPKSALGLYQNFPVESLRKRRFYNIGAGNFFHPYWTNVDYGTDHYSSVQKKDFINYDLMKLGPLPIESNVAEIVYSSHTIEHINDAAVENMIQEVYRILKPGGCLRLTTPDAYLEYRAYKRNDIKYWYWVDYYSNEGTWEKLYKCSLSKASIHQLFLHHFASQVCEIDVDDTAENKVSDIEIEEMFSRCSMEVGLSYFTQRCKFNPNHPGNHINWWTHDKLLSFLKKTGFSECYQSGYGQSLFSPLRDTNLFDNTHPKISLYVEAIK